MLLVRFVFNIRLISQALAREEEIGFLMGTHPVACIHDPTSPLIRVLVTFAEGIVATIELTPDYPTCANAPIEGAVSLLRVKDVVMLSDVMFCL